MRRRLFAIAASLAAASVSSSAFADDPTGPVISQSSIPSDPSRGANGSSTTDLPAPNTRTWVNRPLMITGALVLVGSYIPSAIVAFTSDRPSDQKNLYYPIVGPWMDLADRDCSNRPCPSGDALGKVLLIGAGVGQGLGALGIVTSFFLPNKVTRNWYLVGNERTNFTPSRVGTGYGLSASGKF
jgi:hypothetical protein